MNIHSAFPPAHSSRSSPHSQAPRSLSLVLLPSDQMSTSSPQAEKTALGTQGDTWETEPAHVLLPHSTQHEAAAQSPCLSSTLTPSPHPHQSSFLEGSQYCLLTAYPPVTTNSFLLQTPPSAANEPMPFHSAVTHCLCHPSL